MSTARYTPTVGGHLTVMFPGEIMRCKVDRLVDTNRVLIEISQQPISKMHQYRKGDVTGARRRMSYGREVWEALDDRDFLADRSPMEPIVPEKPKRKAPAKRKKRVA